MIKFFYVLNEKYCQYLSTNSFQDFTNYLTETIFSSIKPKTGSQVHTNKHPTTSILSIPSSEMIIFHKMTVR